MTFTEANAVERMIIDAVARRGRTGQTDVVTGRGRVAQTGSVSKTESVSRVREDRRGHGESLGGEFRPARWDYLPAFDIPRQIGDVMVEPWVREALVRLNPEIADQPDRADEVIYNLRACILSVQSDGLVRANENFMAWQRGEKTMPFGPHGEHVPVRLVDAAQPANNRLTVCNRWTYQAGAVEKRFDVVFLVNGLPLVIGEAKTPTRSAVTWFDGAFQIGEIYEKQAPAMFVPNVFSFATEGKLFRYGAIRPEVVLDIDPIRDKATLPLYSEAPAVKLKIDKAAIDEAYGQIAGSLSEQDRDDVETLVLDAQVLEEILKDAEPGEKARDRDQAHRPPPQARRQSQVHGARRAAGAEGAASHPVEIQAAHRSGAIRQSVRLHSAVLLTSYQQSSFSFQHRKASGGWDLTNACMLDTSCYIVGR